MASQNSFDQKVNNVVERNPVVINLFNADDDNSDVGGEVAEQEIISSHSSTIPEKSSFNEVSTISG